MSNRNLNVVAMAVAVTFAGAVPVHAQRTFVNPPQGTPQAEEPRPDLDLRENVAQSFFTALLAFIDQLFGTIFGVGFLTDLFSSLSASADTTPACDGSGDTRLAMAGPVPPHC